MSCTTKEEMVQMKTTTRRRRRPTKYFFIIPDWLEETNKVFLHVPGLVSEQASSNRKLIGAG